MSGGGEVLPRQERVGGFVTGTLPIIDDVLRISGTDLFASSRHLHNELNVEKIKKQMRRISRKKTFDVRS